MIQPLVRGLLLRLLLSAGHAAASTLPPDGQSPWMSSYRDWRYQSELNGLNYTHSSPLGVQVTVHWTVKGDALHLGVAAGASGWVGFGLADAGRMKGADLVVLEAAHPQVLSDWYALENGQPKRDSSQDWEWIASTVESNFIAFHGRRLLNTLDPQDRILFNDSQPPTDATPIIVAWGDTPEMAFHGNNTGRGVVRFFGPPHESTNGQDPLLLQVAAEADGSFRVTAGDYSIPPVETDYYEFCVNLANITGAPNPSDVVHLIGVDFVPSIEVNGQDTLPHVHHFAAFGAVHECESPDRFPQFFYGWGPGQPPLLFPRQVGIPLGARGGFLSINLQIHYDNKFQIPDLTDSSGIRLWYTWTLREHSAAVLFLGDPYTNIKPQPVGDGPSQHLFTCPSNCTAMEFAPDAEVTVFSEAFHMHQTAVRGVNRQVRNGAVVREASVDFFDFWAGGIQHVRQEPFVLKPGDEFQTTCYYDSGSDVVFGNGTRDEMCVAFLWYYPAISQTGLGFCGPGFGSWTGGACEGVYEQISPVADDFDRMFGQVKEADDEDDSEVQLASQATKMHSFVTVLVMHAIVTLVALSI